MSNSIQFNNESQTRMQCPDGRPGRTLQDRMALARSHPQGFDYLRILLAISIVLWHTVVTCYGGAAQDLAWSGWRRPFLALILPMFFALSGFLVAGSLERCKTLAAFLSLRVLRLIPALAVEICLSALLVGPLVTDLSLHDYFNDPATHAYFLNIVGDMHYALPGVFSSNPFPYIVNGQLWTVPFELKCYVAIAILAVIGLHHYRRAFFVFVIAVQVVFGIMALRRGISATHVIGPVPGRILVLSFLAGVTLYLNRGQVAHSSGLALLSLAVILVLLAVPSGDMFIALPAAYWTVYLGTLNPSRPAIMKSGDYSYGIFLYGFPVQQAVSSLGPWARNPAVSIGLSLPIVALIAALSWHGVEKHALKLRRYLPAMERLLASVPLTGLSRFKIASREGRA